MSIDQQNQNESTPPAHGKFCCGCGKPIHPQAEICMGCGVRQQSIMPGGKSRVVAGVLGIFLGGFGIHQFYMGKVGIGVIYLLLFWTFIPGIIGFIEGIIYLCESDENFSQRLC